MTRFNCSENARYTQKLESGKNLVLGKPKIILIQANGEVWNQKLIVEGKEEPREATYRATIAR